MGIPEFSHKRIGELNGPWAFLLKTSLVAVPIFVPFLIGWAVWVTQRINSLETGAAVINKITEQIAVNTPKLAAHEKQLTVMDTQMARHDDVAAQSHEILHQKVLNEVGTLFAARFDEMRLQMTAMQKDILRVQLLVEGRLLPLQKNQAPGQPLPN